MPLPGLMGLWAESLCEWHCLHEDSFTYWVAPSDLSVFQGSWHFRSVF